MLHEPKRCARSSASRSAHFELVWLPFYLFSYNFWKISKIFVINFDPSPHSNCLLGNFLPLWNIDIVNNTKYGIVIFSSQKRNTIWGGEGENSSPSWKAKRLFVTLMPVSSILYLEWELASTKWSQRWLKLKSYIWPSSLIDASLSTTPRKS